jgi:hypothetical protein
MIRYYIEPSETRYLWKDPEFEIRFDIDYANIFIKEYVEILESGLNYYYVVIVGSGQQGYLPNTTYNPIRIYDPNEELYDGRFNTTERKNDFNRK